MRRSFSLGTISFNFFFISFQNERYTMKVVNSNWYIFFRLHNLLCSRLSTIYEQSVAIVNEDKKDKATRKEAVSIALRLKPKRKSDFLSQSTSFNNNL